MLFTFQPMNSWWYFLDKSLLFTSLWYLSARFPFPRPSQPEVPSHSNWTMCIIFCFPACIKILHSFDYLHSRRWYIDIQGPRQRLSFFLFFFFRTTRQCFSFRSYCFITLVFPIAPRDTTVSLEEWVFTELTKYRSSIKSSSSLILFSILLTSCS